MMVQDTLAEVASRMVRNKGKTLPKGVSEVRGLDSKPGKATRNGSTARRPSIRKATSRSQTHQTQVEDVVEIEISSGSATASSEDDILETPSPSSIPEDNSHKRKSILQPKGSKYSKKASKRRGKAPPANPSESGPSSDEEHEVNASPMATAATRNGPTLISRTQVQPRKHASALDDYSSHHSYQPRVMEEKILVSYRIPSTKPQGPGGVWTCSFEGCNKRIHAASTGDGKAEIRKHFEDHSISAQEKIQLAMAESRPYLPVGCVIHSRRRYAWEVC